MSKQQAKSKYVEVKDKKQQEKIQKLKKNVIEDDRQVTNPKMSTHHEKEKGYQGGSNKKEYNQKPNYNNKNQKYNQDDRRQNNKPQQKRQVKDIDFKQNQRYQREYENKFKIETTYPNEKPLKVNEIFLDANLSVDQCLKKLFKLIQKYDFVSLKAIGSNITKAIIISEQMNKQFIRLRRINIPGSTQIEEHYIPLDRKSKQYTKIKTKPYLKIEFSLNQLDVRHMGYQDNIVEENYNRNKRTTKPNAFKPKYDKNQGQYR